MYARRFGNNLLEIRASASILAESITKRVSEKSGISPLAPKFGGTGIESPPDLGDLADAIALRKPQRALHQAATRALEVPSRLSESRQGAFGLLIVLFRDPLSDEKKYPRTAISLAKPA